MTLNDSIKIVSLDDISATELRQIDVRLRTLLHCTETTIPGSRAFGLPGDAMDLPVNLAANQIAIELQEKADIYVPEVRIDSVEADYGIDGKLELTINIRRRDVR